MTKFPTLYETENMEHVKSSDLRKKLSQYIWRVSHEGETFLITDYGRPVAVLGPVPEETKTDK